MNRALEAALAEDVEKAEDRLADAISRAKDLGGPRDTTLEIEMIRADVYRAQRALRTGEQSPRIRYAA